MGTRVSVQAYVTDSRLRQRDGVNFAHENVTQLLREPGDHAVDTRFHDINELLADPSLARRLLKDVDWVVSNTGPHAHYYFWLREELGLNFHILRDARTAIWSSYLHQEHLCQPLLRPGDLLMVSSHYSRGLYEKFFPALREHQMLRCYPLTVAFPDPADFPRKRRAADDHFNIGYLGRLSDDKNFPALVDLVIRLNQEGGRRYRLVACGDIHSPSCEPATVRARLKAALGCDAGFEFYPACDNRQIWRVLARFDAMLFPSTSNLETFGRVIIEASHLGIPVVATCHAATPELIPAGNLVPVQYEHDRWFDTHFDHSLGRPDLDALFRLLIESEPQAGDAARIHQRDPDRFLATLAAGPDRSGRIDPERMPLAPSQARFVDAVELDMPARLDAVTARNLIGELVPWFRDLQCKGSRQQAARHAELARISRFPERTTRYLETVRHTRADYTHVGGIDIELCHVTGFHPRFRLNAAPAG